jgi:hypothetical protein
MKAKLLLLIKNGVQRRHFIGSLGFGTIGLFFSTPVSAAGLLTSGKVVSLRCLGPGLQLQYLEGRIASGIAVLVDRPSTKKDSGTRWQVVRRGENLISLRFLSATGSARWLEGRPSVAGVGLSAATRQPPQFSTWRIIPVSTEDENMVGLECADVKNGARWLEAKAPGGTVGLAEGTKTPPGGKWEVRMHPVVIDPGTRLNPAQK